MKHALVVWGGFDGHEPKQAVDRFIPSLEEAGYELEVVNTLEPYADVERLKELDLIVQCWTMGELVPEQELGLAAAIRSGVGLAGWHGGLADAFRAAPLYQLVVGGQFVTHPPGSARYGVRIEASEDPITEGIDDFEIESEQYFHQVDVNNTVLATSAFVGFDGGFMAGARNPFVWKRTFGEGRVFYAGFGHVAADFDVPQAHEIVRRGLLWAGKHESIADEGGAR